MIILDIETTGLDPAKNCMVSLGAVDFDTGEEFYQECRVYWDSLIDDYAMKVNGFTIAQIADPAKLLPHEIYVNFISWAEKYNSFLLAGQQVGAFDIPFLKVLNDKIKQDWLFGYRSVDLHSIAFAKFGESLNLDGILQKCGLEPEPKPHNALTGARLEAQAFKFLLNK